MHDTDGELRAARRVKSSVMTSGPTGGYRGEFSLMMPSRRPLQCRQVPPWSKFMRFRAVAAEARYAPQSTLKPGVSVKTLFA